LNCTASHTWKAGAALITTTPRCLSRIHQCVVVPLMGSLK
jgi:hypothetical protein